MTSILEKGVALGYYSRGLCLSMESFCFQELWALRMALKDALWLVEFGGSSWEVLAIDFVTLPDIGSFMCPLVRVH